MLNQKVSIHDGKNSVGTMFITEKFIDGVIVKENEKSIRVKMTGCKYTCNGKIERAFEMNKIATFAFWKVIDSRSFGKNAGKKVSLYKNKEYGLIEIVVK